MFRNYYLTYKPNNTSDWPQRITTICVGVPILWILFSYTGTRQSFFQGTHAIMCWEWMQLTVLPKVFLIVSIILVNIRDPSAFQSCLIGTLALTFLCSESLSSNRQPRQHHHNHHHPTNTHHHNNFRDSSQFKSFNVHAAWIGLLLITVPCRSMLIVQDNFYHIVSLLLVVWNGDTGALLLGRCWRLITCAQYRRYSTSRRSSNSSSWMEEPEWLRRISPSKSIAGLLGGIIGATGTYCFLPTFWEWIHRHHLAPAPSVDDDLFRATTIPISSWDTLHSTRTTIIHDETTDRYAPVLIGFSLGCAGLLGDLWESAVKRSIGTKDTSRLLPGHGGVLDRLDSSLIAVLLYQYYIEQGIV